MIGGGTDQFRCVPPYFDHCMYRPIQLHDADRVTHTMCMSNNIVHQ